MARNWALDLGTTNSTLASWDSGGLHPELIQLPTVCREPGPEQQLDVHYSIPSSVFMLHGQDLATRVGSWPWIQRHFFFGRAGLIGRAALERDAALYLPNFVPSFKRALLSDPYQRVARVGGRDFTAMQVAQVFLRELMALTAEKTGERPRDLVFSVPVECYEPYRAVLAQLAARLGVAAVRTIDEPVAAALGYGLRVDRSCQVMVLDFGGGTLDLAVLRLEESRAEAGNALVLAKEGAPIGGSLVDAWLVEHLCEALGFCLERHAQDPNAAWWYRVMLEEACRVKEALYLRSETTFFMSPPPELQRFPVDLRRGRGFLGEVKLRREDLESLLERRGLYRQIESCLESVRHQLEAAGTGEDALAEILLVGGSTLLPGVYSLIEQRFGRDRVRAWHPFTAVAFGASAFAGGHVLKSDFISHDYAFIAWKKDEAGQHLPEYHTIVKAGARFPTAGPVWKRQLTPTCSLGEPERYFKLVICELGRPDSTYQQVAWDLEGHLHIQNNNLNKERLIVPLNEHDPTLGTLDPPHRPGDRRARLEISFGIQEDRWLWVTVVDLLNRRALLEEVPVVRLK